MSRGDMPRHDWYHHVKLNWPPAASLAIIVIEIASGRRPPLVRSIPRSILEASGSNLHQNIQGGRIRFSNIGVTISSLRSNMLTRLGSSPRYCSSRSTSEYPCSVWITS